MTVVRKDGAAAAPGLVICAKTGRLPDDLAQPSIDDAELEQLTRYEARFPRADELETAIDGFPSIGTWDGHEGPRHRVTVAPGAFGVRRRNLARRERTFQRWVDARQVGVQQLVAYLLRTGELPPTPAPRREITEWSRKSRANMTQALCEIDFTEMLRSGRPPAMVTLTYPGDWQTVAPNGRAVKAHLQEFRHRWERAWGEIMSVWKLEFQRRGAAHFHMLVVPPRGTAGGRTDAAGWGLPFKQWLSLVWADIVSHPDPDEYLRHLGAGTNVDFAEGMRLADPRRVAVYFTKHGQFVGKEYQHIVPLEWQGPGDGPGRFWGYWGLERKVHAVEISPQYAALIARVTRRWAHAQRTTRQVRAPRTPGGRAISKYWDVIGLAGAQLVAAQQATRTRRVRRRATRLKHGTGWVSVNNGATFATQVARYIRSIAASTVERIAGPVPRAAT